MSKKHIVAVAESRFTQPLARQLMTDEELLDRFANPILTPYSVAECQALPKAQRDNVKDCGGFVLADLIDGLRGKDTVVCRTGITYDVDKPDAGFLQRVLTTAKYQCVIYSTHSHTPEKPRYRIVILFNREVTTDEYAPLSRIVASEFGIDCFDPTTFEPERLMYWPSHPYDGEYVFEKVDGPLLDPDEYLAKLEDWRDCSLWPTPSKEGEVMRRKVARQKDPLTKPGTVGAFCRAYYPIANALDTFLADIYGPSERAGRYDYLPAESTAGVKIYDDKFIYSHHASDPVEGNLLNAFDVVRRHLFKDLTEQESFKAMCELAVNDEQVCAVLRDEHRSKASLDFENLDDWQNELTYDRRSGALRNTRANLLLIYSCDPKLAGIRFNELDSMIYGERLPWKKKKAPWRNVDTSHLMKYVDRTYGELTARNHEWGLEVIADERAYHPIRDYLDGLPEWDQTPRVETLFIDYLGAEDSAYVRAVTRKTLVAAIARIICPGIKFDNIPVLNGGQGIGKSTLIARLGRNWYSDSLSISDMKDKTAAEKLQGYWILELSEMAGIRKMDVEAVKAFASRTDDKYRPSYGRVVECHERQCVIIGTTNNDGGFLRDVTGNRRFWPIQVTGKGPKRPWDLTDAIVDQIWAEALHLFAQGEELYLTGELARAAAEEQRDAMETDDREGVVAKYLDTLLPADWDKMGLDARKWYLRDPHDTTQPKGTTERMQVSNIEVWCECFERPREALMKSNSFEIEAIIKSIGGWRRYEGGKTGKKQIALYGPQRVYLREPKPAPAPPVPPLDLFAAMAQREPIPADQ